MPVTTYLAATAASLAKSIPEVATTTGEASMRGIWALVMLLAGGLFGGWRIWLKGAPEREMAKAALKKAKTEADTAASSGEQQLRSEMWRDIQNLKLSKEETSRRLTMAETKISEQSSQIGQLRFLVSLLNAELERVSPQNAIARQVRVVMEELQTQASSSSAADTGIMADTLAKLCKTDEEGGQP